MRLVFLAAYAEEKDLLKMLNEPIIHWMEVCGKLVRIQLHGLVVLWIHHVLISSAEVSTPRRGRRTQSWSCLSDERRPPNSGSHFADTWSFELLILQDGLVVFEKS